MTYRQTFTQLKIDLSKFDPNEIIVVIYDKNTHNLQFTQLNLTVITSYLRAFYLPKKNFKIGILNQHGYNQLMHSLDELLKNNLLDDMAYIPDRQVLGTDWYREFQGNELPEAQVAISLRYVNVTNKFWVRYICKHYSPSSKTLYKLIKKSKS